MGSQPREEGGSDCHRRTAEILYQAQAPSLLLSLPPFSHLSLSFWLPQEERSLALAVSRVDRSLFDLLALLHLHTIYDTNTTQHSNALHAKKSFIV